METQSDDLASYQDAHFSCEGTGSSLCNLCSAITIRALVSRSGYAHQPQVRRLREEFESAQGCPLCSLIWARLLEDEAVQFCEGPIEASHLWEWSKYSEPSSRLIQLPLDSPVKLLAGAVDDGDDRLPTDSRSALQSIRIFCGPPDVLEGIHWKIERRNPLLDGFNMLLNIAYLPHEYESSKFCKADLRLTADCGTGATTFIAHRTVHKDPICDITFRLLTQWLQDCTHDHPACALEESTCLPTRLVDIGDAGCTEPRPRLVIPNAAEGRDGKSPVEKRYIALSYCWGLDARGRNSLAMTTSKNVQERTKGFDLKALPRTIQDAITLARKFEVRYIWVDSLCILQGSELEDQEDWARESVRMADVYGGAWLTIAAASAKDMQDGILFPRQVYEGVPLKLTLGPKSNTALGGHIHVGSQQSFVDVLDEPLYHRGWTLQERILSRRILICKNDQFAWECQTRSDTESGTPMRGVAQIRFKADSEPHMVWPCIVTDYSARSLSHPTDKLIAIASLASRFAAVYQRPPEHYLAGLWKSTILDDLLWAHTAILHGRREPRCRPLEFRAASWSWASVDGNVRWPAYSNTVGPYDAAMIDSHVETASAQQPYGRVSAGSLTLKGPLHRVIIEEDTVTLEFEEDETRATLKQRKTGRVLDLYLDVGDDCSVSSLSSWMHSTQSSEIWLFQIARKAFLIVVPVSGQGKEKSGGGYVFRRVGTAFQLRSLKLRVPFWKFEDMDIETITLE